MSRWLWVLILLCNHFAFGNSTSTGPLSDEEAQVLWREGRKSFQNHQYQDAIPYLQRLADRYPDKPGYFESHLLLGQAFLGLHRPREAIAPLQFFLNSKRARPEAVEALLTLSSAYLDLGKFSEAHLSILEIEQTSSRLFLPEETRLRIVLLKAQVLFELNQDSRSLEALSTAKKKLRNQTPIAIQGQAALLQLKLKLRACQRPTSPDVMKEAQVKLHSEQNGVCLLEALLDWHTLLKISDPRSVEHGSDELAKGFQLYAQNCAHPVKKWPVRSLKSRAPAERLNYAAELTDEVKQDCQNKLNQALGLLQSWKPPIESPAFKQVQSTLETLISTRQL